MDLKPYENCKKCLLYGKRLEDCPFCTVDFNSEKSIKAKHREIGCSRANCVINRFKNFTEVVQYKEEFSLEGCKNTNVDRSRKWALLPDASISPLSDKATLKQLRRSRERSRKRALDSYLGYALVNDWRYFITLTFDLNKINRYDVDACNYAWQLFRQKLQRKFPDIQILLVKEKHTDTAIHFHGLIGNADLSSVLARAVNLQRYRKYADGNIMYDAEGNPIPNKYYLTDYVTKMGDPGYNFLPGIFDYGFNSIVPLHPTDKLTNNDKAVMYLIKYMKKDTINLTYNKRAYYRTYNLKYKGYSVTTVDSVEAQELLKSDTAEVYKVTDRCIITHIPVERDINE